MDKTSFLLVKGTAGLGNRMLSALTGYLYAELTGRQLVIDWTDPMFSGDRSNVFAKFFQAQYCRPIEALPGGVDVFPDVWRGNLHLTPMQLVNCVYPKLLGKYSSTRVASADVRRDYLEETVVFWSWDAQVASLMPRLRSMPRYSGLSRFEIIRKVAREMFVLMPEIGDRVEQFKTQSFDRPMIGIHIRHTDRTTPLTKFHQVLKRLKAKVPEAGIFLATDNPAVEAQFRNMYERVVTTDKDYPSQGAIHMDLAAANRTERAMEALAEMYLLAGCDYLVYASRSTFSHMSHLLSDLPERRVIDLDRWSVVLRIKRTGQAFSCLLPRLYGWAERPKQVVSQVSQEGTAAR